jgi:hypothetical protein
MEGGGGDVGPIGREGAGQFLADSRNIVQAQAGTRHLWIGSLPSQSLLGTGHHGGPAGPAVNRALTIIG